ncbi:hypothetical protein H8S90_25585 [Olivibacter sp. SDN3]|uniref:hypothetical protein n=1 Tax=Olivibacter sp. SDN3 TaxID=2764720 RepID=UPI0016518036|nr:hypothetical protein [Olivibacter sp. SDN3]QNL50015.1 hypothetical protein H8S90_25585 [Olivibacter sp. SDN3]
MTPIRYYIAVFVVFFMISSCVTATYIGDRFQPTHAIDVYYAGKDVKKGYKVIGHLSAPASFRDERSKKDIIAKAKAVGADGVIIVGSEHAGGEHAKRYNKAEAIKYGN